MTELDFIHKTLDIKNPPDFTVVSTFSGGGGSSTGYVWAGGKVLLAVEWDDNAVATYRLNYPGTDVYHGDIAQLSVDEVLQRTGLQPGELDIFDGSPPCQGFSTAGKRMLDDDRNQLFREYVRLLRGLRPKVMVMENVSGMVKGKMKLLFAEILRELKTSGYRVSARLLNAKYLGVPQSRERMIFIGVRNDLGVEPSHPKPQTRGITVGEAINDCPEYILHSGMTKLQIERWNQTTPGKAHAERFSFLRLNRSAVANTIVKIAGSGGLSHYCEPRFLSIGELRRLQSFPDCYEFVGHWNTCLQRIGNSVPPRMMQYIAEHIRNNILAKITHDKSNT